MIGYLKNYKKNIGKNLKNFLMIHKNGIVHSWRLKSEYDEFLDKLKTKRLRDFEKILDKLRVQNEQLKKFLEYKKLDNFNDKKLLKIFTSFVNVYQNYFPLFTLPKYFGMVLDENKLSQKIKNKLKEMRGVADYEKIQKDFLPLFFKEIEKRKKIKNDLLFYALPKEIINLLKNNKKIKRSILKNRKKLILFLTTNDGKMKIFTGKKARRILRKNIKEGKTKTNVIKGNTANEGLVTGRVRIILRKNDLNNLAGKIIVAPMTSIKFVPYLKNILGIVTNEGGIACHAAIISRELNIPCVIGTHNATKILQNGDLVELNADRGTVKIIKRMK
jgi:phosphohistidine swiveling domain-containing protein